MPARTKRKPCGDPPNRRAPDPCVRNLGACTPPHRCTLSPQEQWALMGLDPVAAAKPGGPRATRFQTAPRLVSFPLTGLYLITFAYCMANSTGRRAARASMRGVA